MAASEHLDGFELLAEDYRSDAYVAYRARREDSSTDVRLTLFDESVSASPAFRAAFRKDQPNLSHMHHPHLLSPVCWGDEAGQMYYVTEAPPGRSLADSLASPGSIKWDEFIDLGWQIASALQHAHNVGLTHGHLTTSLVAVTSEVRSKVMGVGLYRWIAAATNSDRPEAPFAERALQDLVDLGHILDSVFQSLTPEVMQDVEADQIDAMSALIRDLQHPAPDLLARDVQGRLGNMLLQASGESIEMVDHRKGQHLSRRSIVDELFDEPIHDQGAGGAGLRDATDSRSWWIVALIAVLLAAAVLALVTFWNS